MLPWYYLVVLVAAVRALPARAGAGHRLGRFQSVCSAWRISAARSPTMTQGAMVFPVVTRGMIEASAMRRCSVPWTFRVPSCHVDHRHGVLAHLGDAA